MHFIQVVAKNTPEEVIDAFAKKVTQLRNNPKYQMYWTAILKVAFSLNHSVLENMKTFQRFDNISEEVWLTCIQDTLSRIPRGTILKTDTIQNLKEIEKSQPEINRIRDSLLEKLGRSTFSNPISTATVHNGNIFPRTIPQIIEQHSELEENIVKARQSASSSRVQLNLGYNCFDDAWKLLVDSNLACESTTSAVRKQILSLDSIRNLGIFEEKIKLLKQCVAELQARLNEFRALLDKYLKERDIWGQSLIHYTNTLDEKHIPMLQEVEEIIQTEIEEVEKKHSIGTKSKKK